MAHKTVHDHCPPVILEDQFDPSDDPQSTPGPTLADAVQDFLSDQEYYGCKPGTVKAQGIVLGQLVAFARDNHWPTVTEIEHAHIREYMLYLRKRPRWFGVRKTQEVVSPGYLDTVYRRFRRFFNYLVEQKIILASPMEKKDRPKVPEQIVPTIEMDQAETLLRLTAPKNARNQRERFHLTRDHAAFYFFIDTSVRKAGFANIQMGDIDVRAGKILVTEKFSKPRFLRLGHDGVKALREYLKLRDKLVDDPRNQSLWVDYKGKAMWADWVRKMMYRRGNQAEIPDLHPHRFRHTFITRAIEADINQTTIEQMCGVTKIPQTYLNKIGWAQIEAAHQRFSPGDAIGRRRGRGR